ncbi:MAG: Nramp family divalent metal transporter [Candidatus Gracilibacteria bacterium]
MEFFKKSWQKIAFFFAIMGPGLITATADNDSGGIATYAVAGAQFGYSLLWTLIPVTILLVYTLDISTKLGVMTRQGLAALIREKFRIRLTLMLLVLVLLANFGTTVSEFAGILSSFRIVSVDLHLNAGKIPWGTILETIAVIASGVIVWAFIVKGSYKRVEKIFLTLVLFYIAYIISAIMAKPDWNAAMTGLVVPTMQFDSSYLFTMVGLIGTTITPWMYFYHNATVAEKGISEEDLKYSRIDAWIGSIVTDVVAFFIVVASAATIFAHKLVVTTIDDIGLSLVPIAGQYAGYLFAFGLFNASLFAAAILPLSTAYTICEALGWETGIDLSFEEAPQFYSIFTGLIVLGALVVLIPGAPLLMIMRVSQVANGILLPIFMVYLLLLAQDEKLMGKYALKGPVLWFGWASGAVLIVLDILLFVAPFLHIGG